VAIDIPSMLVHLRSRVVAERPRAAEATAMRGLAWVMRSPRRYRWALRALRLGRPLARRRLGGPFKGWTASRDLPVPPRQTFLDWWEGR
jgi:L-lactate dehydrogenase complex protein LldF